MYDIFRRDRPNSPHGGVMIASKKHLQLGNITTSQNSELISASFTANKKSVTVAAFYRPPNQTTEDYLSTITCEFQELKKQAKKNILIVAGDFNLPDIDWKNLSITGNQYSTKVNKSFLEIVADNNLEQIVDFPTRRSNTLDLILTSHPSFKQRCKPMPSIGASDHDIVLFDTSIKVNRPKPQRRKITLWKKADTQGIRENLKNLASLLQTSTTIDSMWEQFKQKIQETIEKYVPTKMTSSRYTNPWMNSEIKRTIRKKQRAYKKAKSTNKKRDRDRYKRLQKEVKYQIRKANKNYLENIVSEDFKDNSKKFWTYIKSKGQDTTGVSPLKNKDGYIQSSSTARANILNEQFVSVFTHENTSSTPQLEESKIETMPNINVNWKGIHKLLMNLKTNKATGPDDIPAFILKAAASEIAPALEILFQQSVDTGQVPQEWQKALVVPLFKKGDRHQAANYRPVSLTSITCKLLEHIVHSSIMKHFDSNNILCDNQHGFRKHRSCETQLITTIHEIATQTAKDKQVDVIFLDFSKAFDKVPHGRLLQKLDHYGVRGSLNQWVKSFLSNRTQEVVLDGAKSDTAEVLSGVPQGTVLGPLLFLTYINDLPSVLNSSSCKLFADDSAVFKVIENDMDRQLLQEDLNALEKWEELWQMDFNPSKCHLIRIAPRSKMKIHTTYKLHGQVLETVDSSKYLGLTISDDLTWDKHINSTVSKASRTLGFIRRNLRECTAPVKDAVYKAIVRPTLEYSSSVWDPHLKKHTDKIEQVQRRAARFVNNDYRTKTPGCVSNMLKDLQWETLEQRRRQDRLTMFYKIQHGLVDIDKNLYLKSGDARTRGANKFFQERITDQTLRNSFFHRTTREWNSLPLATASAPSLETFRTALSA